MTVSSSLDFLRVCGTEIVTDTGDFESIGIFKPQDATTNPSLLLQAARLPQYRRLVDAALTYGKEKGNTVDDQAAAAMDRLLVEFGKQILAIVPGRVSTEVDARLSYDTAATKTKARHLISLYESLGINRERVLIKIAATWEGIRAAHELKDEGIHCNLTLMFGFPQAVTCGEAGVTLVSPFVGRILDWYKKNVPKADSEYGGENDPGVQFVKKVYEYYKQQHFETVVMAASFRTPEEITDLAGVELVTVSPSILQKLKDSHEPVSRKLAPASTADAIPKVSYIDDETKFRADMTEDKMASELLEAGIKKFAEDGQALMELLKLEMELLKLEMELLKLEMELLKLEIEHGPGSALVENSK